MLSHSGFDVTTDSGRGVLTFWLVIVIAGGQIFIPILLGTILFTRVKRHPIFISMCTTLILSSVLSSLLFYHDKSLYMEPERAPKDSVCLAQASIMHHTVAPTCSIAAFALIFHVWTRLQPRLSEKEFAERATWISMRTTLLVLSPFIVFAAFGIFGSALVFHNLDTQPPIVAVALYCELRHKSIAGVRAAFTAIALLVTAYYEVRIIIALRRSSASETDNGERALFLRVCVFGLYIMLGIIFSVVSMFTSSPVTDMFVASVPCAVFIVFAYQRDILTAWTFWKRPEIEVVGGTKV
ncbi:hypothetical protein BKA62DRAFT_709471 [Auriculariales sp. MPI-PUGE-AT-0066]|nr:hypothetical protein BKA62DRAFT_709471 [Auriculariales sp. MPI-PUGE-AT-0066]